jgi:hypothetical protein
MRWFAIIVATFGMFMIVGLWAALHFLAPITADGTNPWVVAYFSQARIPMFTGFLTLGSFLLTLQTAIIQRLKDAYDTDTYKERYLVLKETNPNVRYYGSLERMSVALSTNVILALTTAATQMSLGFCQTNLSTAICVGMAATTLVLVVYLTIQLTLAHKEWFAKIEDQKTKELLKG